MNESLEFRAAIREAIIEEMERDESVVFFGEDVAAEQGGVFAVTPRIQERFGETRMFDTPISELALAGAAYGAAVTGLRPVFEVMFGDFMALAMDRPYMNELQPASISNAPPLIPRASWIRHAVAGNK